MVALSQVVSITKRPDGRWVKPCPSCGVDQDYLRKAYAIESAHLEKLCKQCSNRRTDKSHRGFYEAIRLSWFGKVRIGAETRGIPFDIEVEDVWAMYVSQDRRCALSCLPIGWSEVGQIHTASLDRVDSSLGYHTDNCQLLHKDVNMMKQSFSQERFVELCKLVADKVKW